MPQNIAPYLPFVLLGACLVLFLGGLALSVLARRKPIADTQDERQFLRGFDPNGQFDQPAETPAKEPKEEAVGDSGPLTPITSCPIDSPTSGHSTVHGKRQPLSVDARDPSTIERQRRSKDVLVRMKAACESPDEERLHSQIGDGRTITLDMEQAVSNIGPVVCECLRDYLALQGETELLKELFAFRPDLKTEEFCATMIELYDMLLRDLEPRHAPRTKKFWLAAKAFLQEE